MSFLRTWEGAVKYALRALRREQLTLAFMTIVEMAPTPARRGLFELPEHSW